MSREMSGHHTEKVAFSQVLKIPWWLSWRWRRTPFLSMAALRVIAPLVKEHRVPRGFLFLPRIWLMARRTFSCCLASHTVYTELLFWGCHPSSARYGFLPVGFRKPTAFQDDNHRGTHVCGLFGGFLNSVFCYVFEFFFNLFHWGRGTRLGAIRQNCLTPSRRLIVYSPLSLPNPVKRWGTLSECPLCL